MRFNFQSIMHPVIVLYRKIAYFLLDEIGIGAIIWKSLIVLVAAFVPILIITYFITLRTPTLIKAQFIVSKVQFTLHEPLSMADLTITEMHIGDGFSEVRLYSDEGISKIGIPAIIKPAEELSSTVLMAIGHPNTIGSLGGFDIPVQSKVSLDVPADYNELTMWMQNDDSSKLIQTLVYGNSKMQIQTTNCVVEGEMGQIKKWTIEPSSEDSLFSTISWEGSEQNFNVKLTAKDSHNILNGPVFVKNLKFIEDKIVDGEYIPVSTILDGSKFSYSQLLTGRSKNIESSSYVSFYEEDIFSINKIVFNPKKQALEITFAGVASEKLNILPVGFENTPYKDEATKDYRLTKWDTILDGNPFWNLLINILIWMISVVVGIVTVVKVNLISKPPKNRVS